ncbi:MAG: hypothetical protein DLM73_11120 [Chthoniobacterales bacterium]|nr:MAG: hypothetical protein DLM73_11120 [Chthoniobacterales bacterium]
MKTYLLAILLSAVAVTSAMAETFVAPVRRHQPKPREQPTAPVTRTEVTGVIPRGIRGGNFLQMFNPRAPRKYGTAEEAITYDPHEPGKWKGIKFFEFRF